MLNELYELRQATDYDAFSFADIEDAEEAYNKAKDFLEMTAEWLNNKEA
ncbi:MAG: hypothetical protein AAGG68_11540 [Bacteroidota bacterium]